MTGLVAPGTAARRYVEIAEGLPIPEEVDWDDAPGQFKLYRGLPRIQLDDEPAARLLADGYGLTRYRWTAADALRRVIGTRGAEPPGGAKLARNTLRPVPSGGSRFPAELYVVAGPDGPWPAGVYHYDAAHHALVTLREGDWTPELAAALGQPAASPGLTLLTSVFFWKNAFKYGELTYRLCGMDLGVVIGQLLALADGHGLPAAVRYQFVDDQLDRLLRLDPLRESVYAAVTLDDRESVPASAARLSRDEAGVLPSRTGTGSRAEREWTLRDRPAQEHTHLASRLSDVDYFRARGALPEIDVGGVPKDGTAELPRRRVDLLAGLARRRSSMGYFVPADMSADTLSALLTAATGGYTSDLDGEQPRVRHTSLFCAINRVSGVEPGVYRFDPAAAAPRLELVTAADLGDEFQEALLFKLFNLTHTNLCVYPAGDYESGFEVHGDRWYRMQNIEAGIVTQRLYLAAAALGLRCHASLGYDVLATNRLLGLGGTRLTALIQVMIGAGKAPGDFYEAAWR
ncbi:SagB family peptide dehydrogenase [Amycolatopsis suaedae]|uniref:SagB/ThcOx family dehydrogenase n=1 Tax=Amycolatopsis suaedae TaxID=2510978 RepID=A0A4Q7JBQ3_9PSEU|nr:SagB family peptide dehydrogenase [Amycolatopsis suaedae]RZQ63933.1 SagB/ThcOx family dehydrogenase [Amycolatopsis suaedae]